MGGGENVTRGRGLVARLFVSLGSVREVVRPLSGFVSRENGFQAVEGKVVVPLERVSSFGTVYLA